jgi:hypothetical protein
MVKHSFPSAGSEVEYGSRNSFSEREPCTSKKSKIGIGNYLNHFLNHALFEALDG